MSNVIEQQLISLLQPLLGAALKVKDGITPEEGTADLDVISNSVLGMGNEVSQGVDEQGNQLVYALYQSEIVLRYFGIDGVMELSALANLCRCASVSERFQRANIGIGRLGKIELIEEENVDTQSSQYAEFRFFIHYTMRLNDPVGAIEFIKADHDGSKTTIHLTR